MFLIFFCAWCLCNRSSNNIAYLTAVVARQRGSNTTNTLLTGVISWLSPTSKWYWQQGMKSSSVISLLCKCFPDPLNVSRVDIWGRFMIPTANQALRYGDWPRGCKKNKLKSIECTFHWEQSACFWHRLGNWYSQPLIISPPALLCQNLSCSVFLRGTWIYSVLISSIPSIKKYYYLFAFGLTSIVSIQ